MRCHLHIKMAIQDEVTVFQKLQKPAIDYKELGGK